MRKIIIPLLALVALTACETVKGAGEDIQSAGSVVSREATRAQSKM